MIGMAQHLHLAMRGTNPPCQKALHLHLINQWSKKGNCTYIWSTNDRRKEQHLYMINQWPKKGSALIYDQPMIEERLCTYIRHIRGTNPTSMFEKACTHIWYCKNQSYSHIRKATPNTHIWPCGNIAHNPVRKAQHLHLINQWSKKGPVLTYDHPMIKERPITYT